MRVGTKRGRKFRFALLLGVALATCWAAYRLWSPASPKPDFVFDTHPTNSMFFEGFQDKKRPNLPYFHHGGFYSPDGKQVAPREIIRDERYPENIDGVAFSAMFFLEDGATTADFMSAARQIWSVCDAALWIASHGQEEMPAILPVDGGKDCAPFFPNPPKHPPSPHQ